MGFVSGIFCFLYLNYNKRSKNVLSVNENRNSYMEYCVDLSLAELKTPLPSEGILHIIVPLIIFGGASLIILIIYKKRK